MYAVMTFQKNVWESRYVFDFRFGILCSKQPIKKIWINSKILCPQSPPFSRANPAKRNERAMGTRMWLPVKKLAWIAGKHNRSTWSHVNLNKQNETHTSTASNFVDFVSIPGEA